MASPHFDVIGFDGCRFFADALTLLSATHPSSFSSRGYTRRYYPAALANKIGQRGAPSSRELQWRTSPAIWLSANGRTKFVGGHSDLVALLKK